MNTLRGFFITGTDTHVGKTLISCALINLLQLCGSTVAGMKPVASGALLRADGLRNDDALALQHTDGLDLAYDWINPYCFAEPIAPHIAAKHAQQIIDIELIMTRAKLLQSKADLLIVEGAGGWKIPLNQHHSSADLAVALGLPVVLVVGLKLGCINHALLTADSIAQHGLPLAGWVANSLVPQLDAELDIIDTLYQRLPSPCWGHVPFLPHPAAPQAAALHLQLPQPMPR